MQKLSAAAASSRTSPATWSSRARPPTSSSTAPPRRASASRRRPSTTCSTIPSASASSRPSTRSRTSTASSSRRSVDPALARRTVGALSAVLRVRRATARCRCRRSCSVNQRAGPLQITHLGQFPATTISFNLAPGASLGEAVDAIQQSRAGHPAAGEIRHHVPGHGAGIPARADQRGAPAPRRRRHDVHRARRALRELHPSDHDSLDAAVGGRRRHAGAA